MNVAIFGDYSYWNDGMSWSEFSERGTLEDVVEAAAQRWFVYKETMIVEDAIGVDVSEVNELIKERYTHLIKEDKRHRRIDTLKISIRHCEQWLANRDAETIRLTETLSRNIIELEELTK